jgi:hypothetical protein
MNYFYFYYFIIIIIIIIIQSIDKVIQSINKGASFAGIPLMGAENERRTKKIRISKKPVCTTTSSSLDILATVAGSKRPRGRPSKSSSTSEEEIGEEAEGLKGKKSENKKRLRRSLRNG